MYAQIYQRAVGGVDNFQGGTSEAGAVIAASLTVLVFMAIHVFIVMWLWNNVLTRVVTFARPFPTFWYALGLIVLSAMLFPGTMA